VLSGSTVTRLDNALPNDNYQPQFGNVEGAVWFEGALYVSEFGPGNNPPPSRIVKIDSNGVGTVVAPTAGTNGLALDKAGRLYGASHKVGGIVRFALPGSTETVVVGSYDGARFGSPNDLTFRSDGTLYFTDPNWQAASPNPQPRTGVYRLAPGGSSAVLLDGNRSNPNGITLSPDEKTLYLTAQDGVFKYAVAADGSVGTAEQFGNGVVSSGDGMVVDCAGNLYVTSNDVIVLSPEGKEVGRISLPSGAGSVTNVAFGGHDRKTLFITAMGFGSARGVYKVDLAIPGYPY
jgi:gluconolactonase